MYDQMKMETRKDILNSLGSIKLSSGLRTGHDFFVKRSLYQFRHTISNGAPGYLNCRRNGTFSQKQIAYSPLSSGIYFAWRCCKYPRSVVVARIKECEVSLCSSHSKFHESIRMEKGR